MKLSQEEQTFNLGRLSQVYYSLTKSNNIFIYEIPIMWWLTNLLCIVCKIWYEYWWLHTVFENFANLTLRQKLIFPTHVWRKIHTFIQYGIMPIKNVLLKSFYLNKIFVRLSLSIFFAYSIQIVTHSTHYITQKAVITWYVLFIFHWFEYFIG